MNEAMTVPKHRIKAVIFDLDGTLVDSEPNYYESDCRLLVEYGVENFSAELKGKYVGMGSKAMLEDVKKIYQINESIETLLAKKNQYYLELARENTAVFPEMKKFLECLKENGYLTALASGSSPEAIHTVLAVTGLEKYFDVILSAEHVPQGKPAPDIFLEAARLLGVAPENCLVMEDSHYGVEAAKRASMYCAALPYELSLTSQESYRQADLLFEKGIAEFTAEKAFAWVTTLL